MCIYPFSVGTGKSTISVLGVGSGTGEGRGVGGWGSLWGAGGDAEILGSEENYSGISDSVSH